MSLFHLIYNHTMVISSYKESGLSPCFDLPLHVLKPLWQLIGSQTLLTCASLGGGGGVALFFLVCIDGDNRLLALETQMQRTFHVSWQRLNSMYHVN